MLLDVFVSLSVFTTTFPSLCIPSLAAAYKVQQAPLVEMVTLEPTAFQVHRVSQVVMDSKVRKENA